MKKRKKEAKFFCESCGSEVPRRAKTCPMCGKFFASVRCPQCGRTGSNEDFINGCPTCGYAVHPNFADGRYNNIKLKNKGAFAADFATFTKNRKGYADSSLPLWIYVATSVVLLILVFCLYSCL